MKSVCGGGKGHSRNSRGHSIFLNTTFSEVGSVDILDS